MTSNPISQVDASEFNFNVAHVATFQENLAVLASRLGFILTKEIDDLDELEVGYLQLSDGFHFYLCKYRSRPSNTVEVFFASQLSDWEARLEQISIALGIPEANLLWKNEGYVKTP
jgi:hypothetical protein